LTSRTAAALEELEEEGAGAHAAAARAISRQQIAREGFMQFRFILNGKHTKAPRSCKGFLSSRPEIEKFGWTHLEKNKESAEISGPK
jgi:hypothetical protein